ncbi:DNA-binding transcriptional LysR family regulator [Neobacillus niacini]|jgi:LysR family transcriptional regulator, transcriptional activator of the cysJI operon|uniref:LysR family transcriptional regulator n=1 Tax=Neobacillus driksii TaxID=3035913 RepID=UPI0027801E64|nr:LysR family transcriptional regulator [Neobacillus niacini]MDQ0971359.1 DNA-binding transcriptional LysR family regulator [Neobacillus niacini]
MDQHLEVFIKVVEKENFSKAAEELHMTQPAVSQYIRLLEQSIGSRLLERNNKYVRLNKAGEIVFHHAKEIITLYTKMQTLVDDLTNKAGGTIAIGASYTFGEYILPHIIAKMKEQYPLIHPSIRIQNTKEIIDLVKKHQLDIGIIEGFYEKATLNSKVVSKDKMVIVASPLHPLLSVKREIRISDLEEETWILREEGSGTREAAENLFRRYDFTPKNVMEFGSTQVIKESVEAGLGISLLSSWAIKKELTNGYIGIIHVNGLPFKRNFSILTPATYQTKALQTFIEILLTYLSDPRKNRF